MRATDLDKEIVKLYPKLVGFASKLTKSKTERMDLVHDTIVIALEKEVSYERGTNLLSWLYKIMYNEFAWTCRKNTRKQQQMLKRNRANQHGIKERWLPPHYDPAQLQGYIPANQFDYMRLLEIVEISELPINKNLGPKRKDPNNIYAENKVKMLIDHALNHDGYADAMKEWGVPKGTVASSLNRAREILEDADV